MFFGHESSTDEHYPNVYFHTPGLFSRAQVDWIRVLKNEVKPNPKQAGDCELKYQTLFLNFDQD
jgi:hypothetical protein